MARAEFQRDIVTPGAHLLRPGVRLVLSCFGAAQSDRDPICVDHDPIDMLADEFVVGDVNVGMSFDRATGPWRCNKQRASGVRRSNQVLWRSGETDDREEHDLRGRNHRTATVPDLLDVKFTRFDDDEANLFWGLYRLHP
jgi:hypothetical protein